MINTWKKLKRKYLFWRLRRVYRRIEYIIEVYDCGHTLLMHLSNEYYGCCVKFNCIADKLAELDSTCPTFRYNV